MDAAHMLIAEAATRLAGEMPATYIEALACALQPGDGRDAGGGGGGAADGDLRREGPPGGADGRTGLDRPRNGGAPVSAHGAGGPSGSRLSPATDYAG